MRLTALLLLIALVVLAVFVVIHVPSGYATQDREHISTGTSSNHWTGTDDLGRDRTVRVAAALLLGLAGAVTASALATGIAVSIGVYAAFTLSGIGKLLMYVSDLFLTLPWLFLLMMVRSALPLTMPPLQSAAVTFLLLALLGWPAYARVTYANARVVKNADWMLHGRAAGLRPSQLARRHVLPHLFPLFFSQFLVCVPACIVAEANLGTLGLGISEPLPSWGSMLLSLQNPAVLASTHWVYLPIVLLVVVLLCLELLVFEAS